MPEASNRARRKLERDMIKRIENLDEKGKEEMAAFFALFENHHDHEGDRAPRVTNPEAKKIMEEFCLLPIHDVTIPMYIREMSLVYMVILFENFLNYLLQVSFGKRQELLRSYSNKSMSFPEILDGFKDGKIGSRMIQKVVDEIMRQSIDDIVDKHLDKKFGCGLEKNPNWRKFREVFYRRNMIVHNGGLPNADYRKKVNPRIQTRLNVDKQYLLDAFNLFRLFARTIYKKLGESVLRLSLSELAL